MGSGARTPEELEALLEDAFVTRDAEAVSAAFTDGAVLVAGAGGREARGPGEIGSVAEAVWRREGTYVAEPRRVVQARDTALILGSGAVNVARRGGDGRWRYAIAFLSLDHDRRGRDSR